MCRHYFVSVTNQGRPLAVTVVHNFITEDRLRSPLLTIRSVHVPGMTMLQFRKTTEQLKFRYSHHADSKVGLARASAPNISSRIQTFPSMIICCFLTVQKLTTNTAIAIMYRRRLKVENLQNGRTLAFDSRYLSGSGHMREIAVMNVWRGLCIGTVCSFQDL